MHNAIKTVFAALSVLTVAACAPDESSLTFDDYVSQIATFAGPNADDCGIAEIGEGVNQNECIAISFANRMPAYAVYKLQGIDSEVATSYIVTEQNRVFRFAFDSDPTGSGASDNGDIIVYECIDPRLSGVTDNPEVSVFICESVTTSQ